MQRDACVRLEQIPNVGPAIAGDLRRIGVETPGDLRGKDPYALYAELCRRTGVRHDPCVIDVFIASVQFMEGAPAQPWWAYTAERKRTLSRGSTTALPARRRPGSRARSPQP